MSKMFGINKTLWECYLALQKGENVEKRKQEAVDTWITYLFNSIKHYRAIQNIGDIILDVGFADGCESFAISKQGFNVAGITLNIDSLKYAQKEKSSDKISYHLMDIHTLDFDNNTFAGVVMLHVFEHLLSPMIALFECYRVLKDNGILLFEMPTYEFEQELSHEGKTSLQHIFVPKEEQLQLLCEKCGFKLVRLLYEESVPNVYIMILEKQPLEKINQYARMIINQLQDKGQWCKQSDRK